MSGVRRRKRALLWLGALFMISFMTGCAGRTVKRTVQPVAESVTEKPPAVIEGVVVGNDISSGELLIRELDSDIETVLSYSAVSEMTDRFGEQRDGEDIGTGEIVQADYDPESGKIVSSCVPEDVWEYQEVTDYDFDRDGMSMEFAGRRYQYLDTTYFASQGKAIEMMEIGQQDVLTVRGSGYHVYSVVRTKGHGYIRLAHYDDFMGGTVEVGSGLILPVTKNMLITVRAGTYKVILNKGRDVAVKNAVVQTEEEVTLDFIDYQPVDPHIGTIVFDIEPAGADLKINGTAVNYQKPIALAYGVYRIEVSMTGYTTYTGTLDVEQPDRTTVRVDLVEEKEEVETTTSPSGADKTSTDSEETATKQIDSDHTITVSSPEGAEVYFDNVYKGLAPCTFTKVIGSQTVSLRQNGYITKSYSIDILDDDKDVKLSFSDLAAEASAEPETAETAAVETATAAKTTAAP